MKNKLFKKLMGLETEEEEKNKETKGQSKARGKISQAVRSESFKKVLGYSWPFIVLLLIFAFGWQGLKPYVKELMRKTEMIGEHWFGEEEKERIPDEEYDFKKSQAGLQPAQKEELNISEAFLMPGELPAGSAVASAKELEVELAEAESGQVIILRAGVYELNININQDIAIYGQGSSTVLMPVDDEQAVIRAEGAVMTIKNLVIKDARIGISADKSNISLQKVKFMNLKGMAVWAEESELAVGSAYITGSGQGIGAMNSSGSIEKCIIKNNIKSGIELWSSGFSIKNNIIESNGSYGVFADPGSEAEIEGNYIERNKGFNVRVEGEQMIYR